MPITTKPFASQAQQRFAFGTHQPWAKRWADETDFTKLPKRVRRVRSRKAIGGCTCGETTKEQLAPGVTRIRGNLCNVHGKYGPCDAAQSGKKPKGGKGRKPAKPKKPVKTPEQRAQEREAQQAQNRADVLRKLNIAPDGQQALEQLRNGEQPTDTAALARAGFEQAGLVERGRDGAYRLTASGRAMLGAANAGDVGRAGATIGAARDRVAARQERIDKRNQKKKPKGGKGGAKKPTTTPAAAGPPTPTPEKAPTRAEQRAEILFQQRQQDRQERRQRQQAADADRAKRRQEADARRAEADKRRSEADARRQRAEARAAARAESSANRTNRSSQRRTKAYTPDRVLNAGHTGVMVALRPDPAAAAAIAEQPGVTEPIDQLHLTLAFLGDSSETPLASNKDRVITAVREWAAQNANTLNGTINGLGRFFHSEDDGTNAVFVSPDVPGLPELRQSLVQWIEQSGFDYAQNHGFTPHITVAYVPLDAPTPPIRIETPVAFDQVTLGWGDEQYDIPMNATTKAETYGGVKRQNLDDSVFAGPDRSFPIKTAQDVRDAVQSLGRTKHDKAAVKRGIIRRARAIGATDALPESWRVKETSFQVYKDSSGADRWVSISSTAYRDRDREIVSTKALQGAVALADASGYRGPLRFWHVPGVEIGDCDYQATAQDGRFLIESGTFRSPALAAAVKSRAGAYQVSIGFTHPANEPDTNGVFSHIAIFERSLVPKGRASNPFTQVAIKELRMLTDEKRLALKELLGDENLLNNLLGQVATTDKAAQDGGVAYKDADAPAWAQALIGRVEALETSLKAAPPPVAEEEPPAVEDEAKDDGMGDMEAMADGEPEGDENFLSPAEVNAIATAAAQAVVAELMPHLGIGQKMDEVKSMLGGMAGGYAKKDAEIAEMKEQVKAVADQVADLSGSQPRILAGGYRASQATATVTTDESKLKEAQPTADPAAQAFGAFMTELGFGQPHA